MENAKINRRKFVTGTLGAAGSIALERAAGAMGLERSTTRRKAPNILFLMADDRNCKMGCYGDNLIHTPNFDRLAARGVKLDRAYCQAPLCNPSRTTVMTGHRPVTHGVWDNQTNPTKTLKNVTFMPEFFREHGYYTARLGKIFHDVVSRGVNIELTNTFDDEKLWDLSIDELKEAAQHAAEQEIIKHERYPGHPDPQEWGIVDGPDLALGDAVIARRTAELIEKQHDKPFFIAAGFRRPHVPMVAPKRFFDMYPLEKISQPYAPANDRDDIPDIALTIAKGDEKLSEEDNRRIIAAYCASSSFMDEQLGVILDALDRTGRWKDTIVVFTADHGYHLGEHLGLWRKRTLFEEAARVPLFIAAPGVRPGSVSSRLVETVDLYPTLSELAGLPTLPGLEGTSFVPLMRKPQRNWKRAAYSSIKHEGQLGTAVITEQYRYSEWGKGQATELYDLQSDPKEFTNLVTDPKHSGTISMLQNLLKDGWRSAEPQRNG
jgi:uncharacterized sulfatase